MERNDETPSMRRVAPGQPAHIAPKKPSKAGQERRSTAKPRPKGPAPGQTGSRLPEGPEPIVTPNLWGPDAAIMKQPSVVEKDLADEDLHKTRWGALAHGKKIAVYITSVVVVLAVFTAAVVGFGLHMEIPG